MIGPEEETMKNRNKYFQQLSEIRGKTIAIVYIFEGEDAPGFQHYWVWKSDIISGWLNAVQELECIPYILDVRTFIHKAINKTLPIIDYVLNLNCGSSELSSMSLVPSVCSFLSIPCIPCDSAAIVMGENKRISNLLALAENIPVPKTLLPNDNNGIYRPLNLGSSIGIKLGECDENNPNGLYQEFIPGYDVTIPIVFNPYINKLDLLTPLVYIPHSHNPNWIYDTEEKYSETENFVKLPILEIEPETREKILNFVQIFPITTYGRIDGRIRTSETELSTNINHQKLSLSNLYFIEINSMPTIEYSDSFEMSYNHAKNTREHSFFECINDYCEFVKKPTMIGFLLSSSILSFKAKFLNQKD